MQNQSKNANFGLKKKKRKRKCVNFGNKKHWNQLKAVLSHPWIMALLFTSDFFQVPVAISNESVTIIMKYYLHPLQLHLSYLLPCSHHHLAQPDLAHQYLHLLPLLQQKRKYIKIKWIIAVTHHMDWETNHDVLII